MTGTDADLTTYVEDLADRGVRLVAGSIVDMAGVAGPWRGFIHRTTLRASRSLS